MAWATSRVKSAVTFQCLTTASLMLDWASTGSAHAATVNSSFRVIRTIVQCFPGYNWTLGAARGNQSSDTPSRRAAVHGRPQRGSLLRAEVADPSQADRRAQPGPRLL